MARLLTQAVFSLHLEHGENGEFYRGKCLQNGIINLWPFYSWQLR
jgi:hypothetical protein